MRMGCRRTLKHTQKAEGDDDPGHDGEHGNDHEDKMWMRRTLKHTQRLKGRVTRTMSQDMAVNNQPHIPIPSSASSAEIGKIFRFNFYFTKYNLLF